MPVISVSLSFLLFFCVLLALTFEFINGFHDTANAVATVIYTHALKPGSAVIWSGIWNFIGVNIGGIAVAIGIVNLLPVEALTDTNIQHSFKQLGTSGLMNTRKDILILSKQSGLLKNQLGETSRNVVTKKWINDFSEQTKEIRTYTEYSPWWVIFMISIALGLGTMIGWKRIVVTRQYGFGERHEKPAKQDNYINCRRMDHHNSCHRIDCRPVISAFPGDVRMISFAGN